MSHADDATDFAPGASPEQGFKAAIDALIEEKPEAFTPLDSPQAVVKVVEEEVAPLGWIEVHTTRWESFKDSISRYNRDGKWWWIENGYDVSRRPRRLSDGDDSFEIVRIPAPGTTAEPQSTVRGIPPESYEEWRKSKIERRDKDGNEVRMNRTLKPSALDWSKPTQTGPSPNSDGRSYPIDRTRSAPIHDQSDF